MLGYPSHLLRLSNNSFLLTYTSRTNPYEVHARLSKDPGEVWSDAIVLASNSFSRDMGYPSSVQLATAHSGPFGMN